MTEEIINARKTIEKKQLKVRLEEMMTDPQKYDLLRAIYLLERLASYKAKNSDEKEVRKHIRIKGVTTLNLPDVSVVGDGKNITLRASDRKNNTSNTYSVDVGESDKKFEAHYKAENFKLVTDDYDVAISSQKISHFTNRSRPVQYWIALEPDSTF